MAKMGRPKSDDPKLKTLSLRMNDKEFEKLKEYATVRNMTITQVLNKALELLYQTT
ncbi:MAG: CopG family transcriptional regulator [Lachnospiraceae bacterium]|nr:CopG family transcriptional regulator [Lachnospiraceae bacterium]